jgi:hypothetical protein
MACAVARAIELFGTHRAEIASRLNQSQKLADIRQNKNEALLQQTLKSFLARDSDRAADIPRIRNASEKTSSETMEYL